MISGASATNLVIPHGLVHHLGVPEVPGLGKNW